MQQQTKTWLHGVIAAFIGGLAGAIDSGIALMIVVPKDFNLGPDLKKTLLTMFVLGVLTGIKVACAYLKQSPLPADTVEVQQTVTLTATKKDSNA